MTPEDVRKALRSLHDSEISASADVREIEGGWSSHVFEVEPDWIVRSPRDERAALGQARERRLLPIIAMAVTFAVPRVE